MEKEAVESDNVATPLQAKRFIYSHSFNIFGVFVPSLLGIIPVQPRATKTSKDITWQGMEAE